MSEIVAATDRILLTAAGEDDEAEFLAAVAASRELHHPWVDVADTPARYYLMVDGAWRDHNRYAITQEDVAGSGLRPAR